MNILAIFIGGGVGSLLRYFVGVQFLSFNWMGIPWATLLSNAVASFLLGIFVALSSRYDWASEWKGLLIIGLCGGFSTFSTFSYEVFRLLQDGNIMGATLNIILSICVCLFCVFIGMKLI